MRVRIGTTEWYPVYIINKVYNKHRPSDIELTDEEYQYVEDTFNKFYEMQDKLEQWVSDLNRRVQ